MTMHKFKVYSKLIGIGLVVLVALLFMVSNREPVAVKFAFWQIWEAPLFALIFAAASLGVIVFLVTRRIRKVFGEVRDLWREEKARKELVDQPNKRTGDQN